VAAGPYRNRPRAAGTIVRRFASSACRTASSGLVSGHPTDPALVGLTYIRRSGAVRKPRMVNFHAEFHGRIHSGPDGAWMSITGQQVNTYGPRPQRIFLMVATRSGLPLSLLHVFADTTATMRVKLLSLLRLVDASGPGLDRAETVTVFNDPRTG
jgi:hypothetical protein